MIHSLPQMSQTYLLGQDILYKQFNEISFYVEDENQENLYFVILKKLFPDIKFEKIFPLGGKSPVLHEARNNIGDRKKVFIVDKDFDDILRQKISLDNVFYLEQYSIENYLIDKHAIDSFMIEQRPSRIKLHDIPSDFFDNFLNDCFDKLHKLSMTFYIVQKYGLPIDNVSCGIHMFCSLTRGEIAFKQQFRNYARQVSLMLSKKGVNYQGAKKLALKYYKKSKRLFYNIRHIPGKFLIEVLRRKVEAFCGTPSIVTDSFIFRLAKNNSMNRLRFLQVAINEYVE